MDELINHSVIICGGRDYGKTAEQREGIRNWLDNRFPGPWPQGILRLVIITGGASGVDEVADMWARDRGHHRRVFFADWDKHGKAAGPIRNKKMLEESSDPQLVIAFPGGKGTANMVKQARAAGVTVETVSQKGIDRWMK